MSAGTAGPASADASTGPTATGAPVRQRATIVLPTTGEFDSRTYRIASALAARGHSVTVLARAGPGLPLDETVDGYRIRRAPVDALHGLPLPARVVDALARRRGRGGAPADVATRTSAIAGGSSEAPSLDPDGQRPSGRFRRAIDSTARLVRIWLTVRAQTAVARTMDEGADLYHGMAYMGIPVALALARNKRAPVVYDARDIYLEARNLARLPGPARWLFGRVERGWARRASRVVTVNGAYAAVMAERWSVTPLVVMNCSYRRDIATAGTRPRRFHERLGLPDDATVVLYHGGLAPERGVEQLIAALPSLAASVHVALLGYGPLEGAIRAAADDRATGGRLHLVGAVPPTELIAWVASADVAAMPIQPTTLNHQLTTPNKLFEAITAGVPVVASDLPGMAGIVRDTGCGVVCDPTDPLAIAAAVTAILGSGPEGLERYRSAARAAAERYSWESQMAILLAEYERLTGRPW